MKIQTEQNRKENPFRIRTETDWLLSTWQHLFDKYSQEFLQQAVHPIERKKDQIISNLNGKEPPSCTRQRLGRLNKIIRVAYRAFFAMDELAKGYIRHTSTLYHYFSGDIVCLLRENSELKKDLVIFRQMWEEADEREKIWTEMIVKLQERLNQATATNQRHE